MILSGHGWKKKLLGVIRMRTIDREIVSALIFSKDDQLLMGKKDPKAGGVYTDCWHLPGGGVEDGEELDVSLMREILEEVGIDISKYHRELVDANGSASADKTLKTGEKVFVNMWFNVYRVILPDKSDQIKIHLNDDLVESSWFRKDELSAVKLTPPSISLFRRLGYIKNKSF